MTQTVTVSAGPLLSFRTRQPFATWPAVLGLPDVNGPL
jgi:hypothetical protein